MASKKVYDDHFARKRFGQNFLTDQNVAAKILRLADLKEGDTVIEVGPGLGALTEGILSSGAHLIAVELDRDLAARLRERFGGMENFELIEGDCLKVDIGELARERGVVFKFISNLPYNITGPMLARLLDEREALSTAVLMVQKEVAERVASGPGTKDFGALTVLLQIYMDVILEFEVPRHLFRPVPKVDSAIIRLNILKEPRVEVADFDYLRGMLRALFSARRKVITNGLKSFGIEREAALKGLEVSGIDPKCRPETVTINQFALLARELERLEGAEG